MKIFVWTLAFFLTAFLIHLVIWKIKVPKKQTLSLIIIFFSILIFYSVILYSKINFFEYINILIFFISLIFAYLLTYTALEADSPSLLIIMEIVNAGSMGLPKEKFEKSMNDDLLVKPRIQDLVRDHFVSIENGKYKLTRSGKVFVSIFIAYRKLLNAPKGG